MPNADPPPAEFELSILAPDGGIRTIYACGTHAAATLRHFLSQERTVAVKPADPTVHGCKGHMAGWPEHDSDPAPDAPHSPYQAPGNQDQLFAPAVPEIL